MNAKIEPKIPKHVGCLTDIHLDTYITASTCRYHHVLLATKDGCVVSHNLDIDGFSHPWEVWECVRKAIHTLMEQPTIWSSYIGG